MTLTEFMLALHETPRTWELFDGALIRQRDEQGYLGCPVVAVLDSSNSMAQAAACSVDLPGNKIVWAADDLYVSKVPEVGRMREMLLWATGLEASS